MHRSKKTGVGNGGGNRRLRAMPLQGVAPILRAGSWFPAADLYEVGSQLLVYMDVSGVDPQRLSVVVTELKITVSGERRCPIPDKVSCVHQLEIESGFFERSILLPKPVDVGRAVSKCSDGLLCISLPLRRNRGKVRVVVG